MTSQKQGWEIRGNQNEEGGSINNEIKKMDGDEAVATDPSATSDDPIDGHNDVHVADDDRPTASELEDTVGEENGSSLEAESPSNIPSNAEGSVTVTDTRQPIMVDDPEQATVETTEVSEAADSSTMMTAPISYSHQSNPTTEEQSTDWQNPRASDLVTAELVDEDVLRQQALEASVVATAQELKESPMQRRRRRTRWIVGSSLLCGILIVVAVVTSVVVTGNASSSSSSSQNGAFLDQPSESPTESPAPSLRPSQQPTTAQPTFQPTKEPSQHPSLQPTSIGIFQRESLDGRVVELEDGEVILSATKGNFGDHVEIISIKPGSYVSQFTNKTELVVATFGSPEQEYSLTVDTAVLPYQRLAFYVCDKDKGCEPGFFIREFQSGASDTIYDVSLSEEGNRMAVCDGINLTFWDFEELGISPTNRQQGVSNPFLLDFGSFAPCDITSINESGTLIASLQQNIVSIYRTVEQVSSGFFTPLLTWSWEPAPEIGDQNVTIAAFSMSGNFVAIGVNLEDAFNATDELSDFNRLCTPCPGENVFFDGLRVRVYDVANDRQVGNTISFEDPFSIISHQSIDLSANGTVLAVGISQYAFPEFALPEGRRDTGQVNVYTLGADDNGNEMWLPLGNPIISPVLGDAFGWSVRLDTTDTGARVLAVGSPFDETPPFQRPRGSFKAAGKAQVFRLEEDQHWKQLGEDLLGEGLVFFGSSVDISGKALAVGIPGSNVHGNNTGEVVVFDLAAAE